MNELNNALSFLQSKNVRMTINNEWFKDCCQFYRSSNPHSSAEELQNFVYEQWLLADLRELGGPCLPSHIPISPKCRLNGKYALQVNQITNIGESGYSQFKKIRSGDVISTFCESEEKIPSWQPKRNRTLKLSLTDGLLNLTALEFEPVVALQELFIPGLKILLTGPIECRRGILLLMSKNIEILGGEVDSLLICNAMENILARKLNFEENPNPLARIASLQSPDNECVETESDVELDLYLQGFENSLEADRAQNDIPVPEDSNAMTILSDQLNLNSPVFANFSVDRRNRENDVSSRVPYEQRQTVINSRHLATSAMDNRNQFLSILVETSLDTHSTMDNSRNSTMNLLGNQSNVPFVNEPRTLDLQSRMSKCSNWLQSTTCANAIKKEKSPIVGVVTPIPSNKRNAESPPLQLDTKSSKIDVKVPNRFVKEEVRKNDFVSIEQLKDIVRRQSPCKVKCFIRVTKLMKKPRIRNDMWLVITEVTDEIDRLQVTFDDEFLAEKIFMISACEVTSQKGRIAANPAVKDRIDELIRNAIVRLLELRGQFSICVVPGNELPVIMNVVS